MDYRALVVLIVKSAGLVLVLYAIVLLPDRVAGYVLSEERSTTLFVGWVVFPVVVPLAVGLFALIFPASSARAVVGPGFASGSDLERSLLPVVFSGVGMYHAITGLVDLSYYLALGMHLGDAYDVYDFTTPENAAGTFSSGVSLVVGLGLVVGARGLSGLIHRLRHGI